MDTCTRGFKRGASNSAETIPTNQPTNQPMATQIIIITGKERKSKKNIFQLFSIYTLIFTASYNINNILPDL